MLNQKTLNTILIVWCAIATLLAAIVLKEKSNKQDFNLEYEKTKWELSILKKDIKVLKTENTLLYSQVDSLNNVKQKTQIKYAIKKQNIRNMPIDSAILFFTTKLP